MKTEDWIGVAVLFAGLGLLGLVLWLKGKGGCETCGKLKFSKVKHGRVLLRNKEVRKIVRDSRGRIVAIEIHREVKTGE